VHGMRYPRTEYGKYSETPYKEVEIKDGMNGTA
jgi:hypothetical protein